jgi:hypothetical protein
MTETGQSSSQLTTRKSLRQLLLDLIASVGEPVRPSFLWRPSLRDADDDMVLEVAVNGQADCTTNQSEKSGFSLACTSSSTRSLAPCIETRVSLLPRGIPDGRVSCEKRGQQLRLVLIPVSGILAK